MSKIPWDKLLSNFRETAGQLKAAIQQADADIEARQVERDRILYDDLGRDGFLEFLRLELAQSAADFAAGLVKAIQASKPTFRVLDERRKRGIGTGVTIFAGDDPRAQVSGGLAPGALAYFLGPEVLVERVADALEHAAWPEPAMPLQQRQERLAQLEKEIGELNKLRSDLAEQLQAAGLKG